MIAATTTLSRRTTILLGLVLLLVVLTLLLGAPRAEGASAPGRGGPPQRLSHRRRQAAAKAKAAQSALEELAYEQRYQHQLDQRQHQLKALLPTSPDDAKKMVPYGGSAPAPEETHIRSLSVGKLRSYLQEREAKCPGCVEKIHLIERAMQVRGWETEGQRVGKELTPTQFSAENAMSFHHMASGSTATPLTDALGNELVPTTQSREQLIAVQLSHGIECSEALGNGTQYCHQVPADDSPAHYM